MKSRQYFTLFPRWWRLRHLVYFACTVLYILHYILQHLHFFCSSSLSLSLSIFPSFFLPCVFVRNNEQDELSREGVSPPPPPPQSAARLSFRRVEGRGGEGRQHDDELLVSFSPSPPPLKQVEVKEWVCLLLAHVGFFLSLSQLLSLHGGMSWCWQSNSQTCLLRSLLVFFSPPPSPFSLFPKFLRP